PSDCRGFATGPRSSSQHDATRGPQAIRAIVSSWYRRPVGGHEPGDPQRVGRYSVLRQIGRGGMSTVYDAYDPELDRHVPLKLVTAWEHGHDQGPARPVREARSMAKSSNPNVAAVYDA